MGWLPLVTPTLGAAKYADDGSGGFVAYAEGEVVYGVLEAGDVPPAAEGDGNALRVCFFLQ